MEDKEKSKRAGDKEMKKTTTPPGQSMISFVSFDGSSSDASKKAVRKQAALSSAAARKATIAKKAAKQKEQEDEQRKALEIQQTPVGAKRKRTSARTEEEAVQTGISITPIRPNEAWDVYEEDARHKKPQRRVVTAYLTPPASSADKTMEHEILQWLAEREASPSNEIHRAAKMPYGYDRQLAPLGHRNWAMAFGEHYENEDTYLPMTPESLASPGSASASSMDPFNHYPVPYHPVYDRLLHHMLTIYAPRGWPALRITNAEGLAWEHFMTQHSLAEPALFLVRCLFASGDLIEMNVLDPTVKVALRSLAIKAINEALGDDKRSVSDGLILAVGRIALTECLYGDKETANSMHRPAQRRMIDLRGGMSAIGFPPLVKRLMRWADRVMSIQSNTLRLLPDDEEEASLEAFDTKTSVDVLESWAPQQGRAMRKKIAIADLIT